MSTMNIRHQQANTVAAHQRRVVLQNQARLNPPSREAAVSCSRCAAAIGPGQAFVCTHDRREAYHDAHAPADLASTPREWMPNTAYA